MATGDNILTYFNGTWHKGNVAIINAADHGAWLGSNVLMVQDTSMGSRPIC